MSNNAANDWITSYSVLIRLSHGISRATFLLLSPENVKRLSRETMVAWSMAYELLPYIPRSNIYICTPTTGSELSICSGAKETAERDGLGNGRRVASVSDV